MFLPYLGSSRWTVEVKTGRSTLFNHNSLIATFSAHHEKLHRSVSILIQSALLSAAPGFSPNPQFYFSLVSASLSLFLPDIWLDRQPHTKTNVMTSRRCNVPDRASGGGDKRNNTKEECWGGATKNGGMEWNYWRREDLNCPPELYYTADTLTPTKKDLLVISETPVTTIAQKN